MNRSSDGQAYKIQAAVLRKKGGPLRIESLELEGPQDDEVLAQTLTQKPKPESLFITDHDPCVLHPRNPRNHS